MGNPRRPERTAPGGRRWRLTRRARRTSGHQRAPHTAPPLGSSSSGGRTPRGERVAAGDGRMDAGQDVNSVLANGSPAPSPRPPPRLTRTASTTLQHRPPPSPTVHGHRNPRQRHPASGSQRRGCYSDQVAMSPLGGLGRYCTREQLLLPLLSCALEPLASRSLPTSCRWSCWLRRVSWRAPPH